MSAVLYALAMWVLLQLLVVWFSTRVVEMRESQLKSYLEMQDRLLRSGIDASAP
jgi:hypothetical protein